MKMLWNNQYVTSGWIVELGVTRVTELGPVTSDKAGAQKGRIPPASRHAHASSVGGTIGRDWRTCASSTVHVTKELMSCRLKRRSLISDASH